MFIRTGTTELDTLYAPSISTTVVAMVVFGAYSTAKRFDHHEGDTSPGPGAYPLKSSVLGAPAPRYSRKLLEASYVRPDGSPALFTERDSWVRGVVGPKVCVKGKHTSPG